MIGDIALKKLRVATNWKQIVAIDPAILAHCDFGVVPPSYRVLFAPTVGGMQAYNINATIFHGTLTYHVTRGEVKDANIISTDILINSIA